MKVKELFEAEDDKKKESEEFVKKVHSMFDDLLASYGWKVKYSSADIYLATAAYERGIVRKDNGENESLLIQLSSSIVTSRDGKPLPRQVLSTYYPARGRLITLHKSDHSRTLDPTYTGTSLEELREIIKNTPAVVNEPKKRIAPQNDVITIKYPESIFVPSSSTLSKLTDPDDKKTTAMFDALKEKMLKRYIKDGKPKKYVEAAEKYGIDATFKGKLEIVDPDDYDDYEAMFVPLAFWRGTIEATGTIRNLKKFYYAGGDHIIEGETLEKMNRVDVDDDFEDKFLKSRNQSKG